MNRTEAFSSGLLYRFPLHMSVQLAGSGIDAELGLLWEPALLFEVVDDPSYGGLGHCFDTGSFTGCF